MLIKARWKMEIYIIEHHLKWDISLILVYTLEYFKTVRDGKDNEIRAKERVFISCLSDFHGREDVLINELSFI